MTIFIHLLNVKNMLDTLIKIGKWQSQGKSEWDRFLEWPKVDTEDKKGNSIKNYTLPIIFDLDENEVIIDSQNLKEYDESDVTELKVLKTKGGNNKAIYVSVPAKKIEQIYKTFFGKYDKETEIGEIEEAIEKVNKSILTEEFKSMLNDIFELKDEFIKIASIENEKTGDREIKIKAIEDKLDLGRLEKLVLLSVYVKSEKRGIIEPIPFAQIPEYEKLIRTDCFGEIKDEQKKLFAKNKLCYAIGEEKDDVTELNLSTRYSLNKMFVTETRNYATKFDKKKFRYNYQVSKENQEYLDYASDFLLNDGFKTRIANVDHVIIPEFQSRTEVNWELAMEGIKKKSDLLFNFRSLDKLTKNIKEENDNEVFWINFVAFESDGNFFKATETIKDVSNFHFSKVLNIFNDLDWEMRQTNYIDWDKVMTEYKERRFFNLYSIYSLIPLRKDKEKKNKVLDLFKSILENRPMGKEILYDYFCELMLCHWYERYNSYTNIQKSSRDYFGISVRNSVFKYHAFFQVLNQLKLIDMEENNTNQPVSGMEEETGNKYEVAIREFFEKMNLNQEQKAMFYLGRMLNKVEYIQKGKTKTVIHKVNFNGMDKDDIERLRIGLIEKAKQYNAIGKVIFIDNKFGNHFDNNNWRMPAQEAVFFLLTGYSFGVGIKDAEELEQKEKETEEQLN